MTTPKELNQILTGTVDSVAAHLLPNGHREGHSWCVGSIRGEQGQSLRICVEGARTGLWSDFATGQGGDLLDLWQQARGLSFIDTLGEAKSFAGVVDEAPLYTLGKKKRTAPVVKPQCVKPSNKILQWFEGRGIFEKSLAAYKVGQQDGKVIVFPYLSPAGELELVKYRDLEQEEKTGKKKIWSNLDPDYHLWGWQAIDDDIREVVICEGEIDALSWYQQGIPALSVPQGAGGGDKQAVWIENDFERLQRFETIFISMDMDKAGQSAVQPIITRLGIERCKVVDLGEHKDANEAHANGMVLRQFLDRAKTMDPEELKQLADHHDEILNEFKNSEIIGLKLPWQKTHRTIRLRPSEISVWAGINSHGKSIIISHVAVEAVAQGERVCIASMEMKPRKLGRKMYQQIIGYNDPSIEQTEGAKAFLTDRVWLFEAYGTTKVARIIEVFSYARKRYGVTHFIVDSLAKCGLAEDAYNEQKAFVDRLMEFAGEFNVHVHLVVHIRKKEDESKVPGKMDLKGTGAISDMVHNVFIVWRNKLKEEAAAKGSVNPHDPDSILNCVKQRETGEEPMVGLFFNRESCQFLDSPDDQPKQYIFR